MSRSDRSLFLQCAFDCYINGPKAGNQQKERGSLNSQRLLNQGHRVIDLDKCQADSIISSAVSLQHMSKRSLQASGSSLRNKQQSKNISDMVIYLYGFFIYDFEACFYIYVIFYIHTHVRIYACVYVFIQWLVDDVIGQLATSVRKSIPFLCFYTGTKIDFFPAHTDPFLSLDILFDM